jgi:hypothetical protein
MQLEAEQNTAFENYKNILEDLKSLGVMPEMCNYGLWFTDVAVFKNKRMQNICDRRKDINREDFSHFVDLLLAVNRFLGYTADEQAQYSTKQDCGDISARKTQALFVSEPKNVTRTDLIVAYYYYYNALHEDEEDMKGIGFKTFFGAFKNELDRILISSYYQPLSGKNIFDVLVAFSSYAYLND